MTKSKVIGFIRSFLECMGGSSLEVENCTTPKSQPYDFRQGRDPYSAKGRGFGRKLTAQAVDFSRIRGVV